MNDELTWRTFLGTIVADSLERQRLAEAMHVNPATLQRWANNQFVPRPEKLRALLDHAPYHHRRPLSELIQKEFPEFLAGTPAVDVIEQEIPSAFYASVLKTYTSNAPSLRQSLINALILQQILSHLDPQKLGMFVILATCVFPDQAQKVRSLRQIEGRGTLPWDTYLGNTTMFFGAESPAGYTVAKHHMIVTQSPEDIHHVFPQYELRAERCIAACPIMMSHHIAGSLVVASTQPHYFSQSRLDIIQQYAEAMTLAFDSSEFFTLEDIELEIMPPASTQISHLKQFQRRVRNCMLEATAKSIYLTRPRAEQLIWQQIEQELLYASWNNASAP